MDDFFDSQTPSSRIKANIVAEYFPQYCKIILKSGRKEVQYLDLFSGPGIYKDNNHSTPLLIAKACAEDKVLKQKVRLAFNDNTYINTLKENFHNHFPEGTFTLSPKFGDLTVGEDDRIRNYLNKKFDKDNKKPTLLFFDPWGYKGIDTLSLANFLKGFGNEIFLFVNIKRIQAAIENEKFEDLMLSLFPTSIDELRKDRKYTANVQERLSLIMDNLANEFRKALKVNPFYYCSFRFIEEDSSATSHYIIHFTKHSKGYELVKQVYHDFDNIGATLDKNGTYTFDAKIMDTDKGGLLDFGDQNVITLSKLIEEEFKGKKLTSRMLFDLHHIKVKGDFSGRHYVNALRYLVELGKINSIYTDGKTHRKSVIISDFCLLEVK